LVKTASVLVALSAAALGFAVPASAGEQEFVQSVQTRYAFLTDQQLRAEGAKVCSSVRGGMPGSNATQMVRDDLGVSVSAAANIVSSAIVELGC
jgi:hypothetical protein